MSGLEKIRPQYDDSIKEFKKDPHAFFLSGGIRSLFYFCIFISGVIFIDFFLPRSISHEKVEDWFVLIEDLKAEEYIEEFKSASTINFRIKTTTNEFSINMEDALKIQEGDSIVIYKSPVFQSLVSYEVPRLKATFYPYINMYGMFVVIPAFMLLFSVIGLMKKIREDVFLTFGVLNIILLCSYFFIRLFYT